MIQNNNNNKDNYGRIDFKRSYWSWKRKQSIARVFLVPGEGNLTINKISGDKYLQYNDTYLNLFGYH
jgi:ribosomal protein S9